MSRHSKTLTSSELPESATARAVHGARPPPEIPEYPERPWPQVALFLVFIVFVYLQGGYRIPALGAIRAELLMGLALLGFSLIGIRREPSKSRALPRTAETSPGGATLRWGVALLIIMLLYVPFSVSIAVSWPTFMDRCLKFALVGYFISTFVSNPTVLRWFFGVYLFAFMKMGQEGLQGYFSGSLVWENQGTPRLHGPTPSYMHPNSFAGTQLSSVPMVAAFWNLYGKYGRVALALIGFAALLITVASGSRTAYVGLLMWGAFVFVRSRNRIKGILIAAAILCLAPFVVPQAYVDRFMTIFTQEDQEGASISLRKEINQDALAIVRERPFGVGVDAFPIIRSQKFGRVQDTHNLYLQVVSNLGFAGFFVFIGYIWSIARSLLATEGLAQRLLQEVRLQKDADEPFGLVSDLRMLKAAASATLGFLVVRLALGFFGHDLYELYWWFAGGVAIALARIVKVAEARVSTFKPPNGFRE